MASPDQYYFGQGKLLLAEISALGVTGGWRWVGNVTTLSGAFAEERIEPRESYTGTKSKARSFGISKDMTWSATLNSLISENLALFTDGTTTSIASGSATAEVLPTGLVAGDMVALANINVSSVVITDSAGSPQTLPPAHYDLNAAVGSLTLLSLPTSPAPTQPFKAAYTFGAAKQMAFFKASRKSVALRYEGINLAEDGAPVVMEIYKTSPSLLTELALINSGTDVTGIPVTFSALLDSRKPASGAMGQFGRFVQGVTA